MVNNKNLSNARFVPDTLIQRSMYITKTLNRKIEQDEFH
jgi:hypothetical protein